MNNNKKILKKSSAAFLAALNIFNFAVGSSKASDPWNILSKGFKAQANENEVKKLKELEEVLCSFKGIDFKDFEASKNTDKLLGSKNGFANFYKLKGVLFIDFIGNKFKDEAISSSVVAKVKEFQNQYNLNQEFVIYKVEECANGKKYTIKQALNRNTDINFIDVDDISNLKSYCENLEKIKKLQEELKIEKDKVQKAYKANEELQKELNEVKGKSIEYFYINRVLRELVKVLKEESGKDLQENSESLAKVQEGIEFEGEKFMLVGKDDNSFLSKFKFKYNEKEETFSIDELIDELNGYEILSLSEDNKFKEFTPIALNDIKIDDSEGKKNDVLNTEAYKEKLKGYIDELNKIIETISSMPGGCRELEEKIETFESNENICKNKAKEVLEKINKIAGSSDDLGKRLDDISTGVDNLQTEKNTAVKNLETANSKARKLGATAVLGWIGTLVSLGCVFQNEFKNTCGTVYKKVLELKNSILG